MKVPPLFDSSILGLGFVPFVDGRQRSHVMTNVPPIAGLRDDTIRPFRLLTMSSVSDHVSGAGSLEERWGIPSILFAIIRRIEACRTTPVRGPTTRPASRC